MTGSDPTEWRPGDGVPVKEGALTAEQVRRAAELNHVWLNAFHTVRPSEAFLADIGRNVLRLLQESEIRGDLGGRVTYIRMSAS